jgi:tetratricopeptide (TPR) repeat protein
LLSEQSDYEGLAAAHSEVAAYHLNRHDLDQALALYLEVDQLRQRAGAIETSDHMLLMLGVVYRKMGDYERANNYLQQLIERGEAQNNQSAVATASHHSAWVCLNQDNLAEARRLCGRAVALYKEIGDTRGTSDAYEQLGLIALAEGQEDEALFHLEESLDIRLQLGNQHGAASSLRHLAVAHLKMRQPIGAVRALCQSLAVYRRIGVLTRHRFAAIVREFFDWTMERRRWTV